MMKQRAAALAIVAMFGSAAKAEPVVLDSGHSVEATIAKLEADVKARGLIVAARVDHAANAKAVGLELRPMQLLIFGNPMAGTRLIEAAPTMGLSLPLKMLAWEGADGKVRLTYDPAGDLAAGRGLPRDLALLGRVDETMAALAAAATKP